MIKVLLLISLLITRLVGLNWGFPYLFHPDENNITSSILQLSCPNFSFFSLDNCLDPHFYAYGHFYTYLGRAFLPIFSLIFEGGQKTPLASSLTLRAISAFSSILTGWAVYKLFKKEFGRESYALFGLFLYVFTPVFIQLAHFGTTESVLILLFFLLLYFRSNFYLSGLLIGISGAIKISGLVLMIVPLLQILFSVRQINLSLSLRRLIWVGFIATVTFILLTPHYWLNFPSFVGAFVYETSVASGKLPVFYTEQFRYAQPFFFILQSVLPYALGWPILLLAALALPFSLAKKRRFYLLIFIFMFVYQSFLFAQWTRFLIYLYPLFIYLAVVAFYQYNHLKLKFGALILFLFTITHFFIGIGYFSIYLRQDTRVSAGKFLQPRLKPDTFVLSESANVVDIPGLSALPKHQSNFLYDLDGNSSFREGVFDALKKADYVVVDSRRIFHNYSCFYFKNDVLHYQSCPAEKLYPSINRYYQVLFDQQNFRLIKTISSYPEIGHWQLPDENAEETFSVFDHPVVRIYQRVDLSRE